MTARRFARLVTLVALLASGVYVLVYLYRWEWNRAIVAGIFFVAAEVALIGSTLLRRLGDLQRQVDQLASLSQPARAPAPPMAAADGPAPDGAAGLDLGVLERLREAAPEPGRHFRWLDPHQGNLGVFVPVLLGAGAMLSGIAYLVERVAGATARPSMERALAGRLGALALPSGGLVGRGPVALRRTSPPAAVRRRLVKVAAATLAVATLWAGVDELGDLTQDRPSVYDRDQATVVDLRFAFRGTADVTAATEIMWATCRPTVPGHIRPVEMTATGPATARLVVNPALGEHAVRRFRGCLADLNLNRVMVGVDGLRHVPYTGDR